MTLRAPSITCLGPSSKGWEPKNVSMHCKHTPETSPPLLRQAPLQKWTYILSGRYHVAWDSDLWPRTATAFLMWAFSFREVIRQFFKTPFQMICAGATRTRHGGTEESVDAVRRQFSEWVSESADVPDWWSTAFNEVNAHWLGAKSPRKRPNKYATEVNRKVVRNQGEEEKGGLYLNS